MKQILKTVWQADKKNFLLILLLNIGVALTGSISIVMLIPMLDLLEVTVGDNSTVGILLQPFESMSYHQRALVIIAIFVGILVLRALLTAFSTVRMNAYMEKYELQLRKELHNAVGSASWETLSEKSSANLINLFTVQCRQIRYCLQWIISLIASIFSALMQLALAI